MADEAGSRVKMGLVGGMGPLAGVALARWFTVLTDAKRDQDHFDFVLVSKPATPDRTAFLKGEGEDPVPYILSALADLERVGCTHYAIACNTAHAPQVLGRVKQHTSMQNVSIVDSVMYALNEMALEPGSQVGLMSTEGTILARIYQDSLAKAGFSCILPPSDSSPAGQFSVTEGIRAVKAGDIRLGRKLFTEVADDLRRRGAKAILLACTEIPLAYSADDSIDTTEALARACVRISGGERKA